MSEDMQHMSKRYETNNGCNTTRTKWTFKTRRTNKNKFIFYNNKLTLIHKNIANSTNIVIVCVYVWARVCVCGCNTTKLQKELQV